MVRNKHWAQHLADGADLQGEAMPGIPVVEIAGQRRVLVERHCGVTNYSREMIRVKVRYGHICICGGDLQLIQMTKEQLVISGRIDSVQLQRRDH